MKQAGKKIILHAGDIAFVSAGTQLQTMLGSCVAITVWHPKLHIGGMCHFALPRPGGDAIKPWNARYAEDCLALFNDSAKRQKTNLSEYHGKIFGGGDMLDSSGNNIGQRNVRAAFKLIAEAGIELQVAHVGEKGHRHIVFDPETGDVWVKFKPAKDDADYTNMTGRV